MRSPVVKKHYAQLGSEKLLGFAISPIYDKLLLSTRLEKIYELFEKFKMGNDFVFVG